MKWFDAHCHWQDLAFEPHLEGLRVELEAAGICGGIVNGTSPADWERVARVAAWWPGCLAAYGVHPWWVDDLPGDWREALRRRVGASGILGEIGLDRWKTSENFSRQEEVFSWQWEYGVRENLPVTVHCLRAWGDLKRIVERQGVPQRGFLLHAYSGSEADVKFWAEAGAYFSFSPSFVGSGKEGRQRAFLRMPRNRILIETDAPSMPPPVGISLRELPEGEGGRRLNHPLNLLVAAEGLGAVLGMSPEEVATMTWENSRSLFGEFIGAGGGDVRE